MKMFFFMLSLLLAIRAPRFHRVRLAERIGIQNQGEVEGYGAAGIRYGMSLDKVAPIER